MSLFLSIHIVQTPPPFLKGALTLPKIQRKVNVTTVTFNYILFIVFLFSLNVGVSPSFHGTVLVPVYRVYNSSFHNKTVSSCYALHTSYFHHAGVTCFSLNLFLKCTISQELMRECTCIV